MPKPLKERKIKMDRIIVIDYGGQYTHLIVRRIRDLGVYAEILPYDLNYNNLEDPSIKAIIFSGGPKSIYQEDSPKLDDKILNFLVKKKIPILGICYGLHLIAHFYGGVTDYHKEGEYGKAKIQIIKKTSLFKGLNDEEIVWMSHGDQVKSIPLGFEILAKTNNCPIAAFVNKNLKIYGIQFHPEVFHTQCGNKILSNFIINIANAKQEWKVENWVKTTISEIKKFVGPDNRVILGLSGGVDSSTTSILLHKAIGERLHCIFVNNGLLRKNEEIEVQQIFNEKLKYKNFHYIDAEDLFLSRIKNIEDPEEKRKIIGRTFFEVFEKKAEELSKKFPNIKYLAQGTIYPDRVESAATSNVSSRIKSHHNLMVPENLKLVILEPLKNLYKDEVRKIGVELGVPKEFIQRHPFPGPGLAIRIIGKVTKERLRILKEADKIFIDELINSNKYNDVWQAFCVFLPVKSVGVMGDARTYENICVVRAVQSRDAMTANFSKLNWDLLEKISSRIINEVKGFNRVLYDISNKPPATIEFE